MMGEDSYMTVIAPRQHQQSDPNLGARLYLFSVEEYFEMARKGVLKETDPVELIEGLLYLKDSIVPPYGVPVGIPPVEIWPEANVWSSHPLRRLTVTEYEGLLREGILDLAKRHELIEGWVVEKMSRNPPHDYVLSCMQDALATALPKDWYLRNQMAITLDESLPEPDLAIVIWPKSHFQTRHPTPGDVALVVEVADKTLALDLGAKCRSYARNRILELWVADVANRTLHVFKNPSGPTDQPSFASHHKLGMDEHVHLDILGKLNARWTVRELFGA